LNCRTNMQYHLNTLFGYRQCGSRWLNRIERQNQNFEFDAAG